MVKGWSFKCFEQIHHFRANTFEGGQKKKKEINTCKCLIQTCNTSLKTNKNANQLKLKTSMKVKIFGRLSSISILTHSVQTYNSSMPFIIFFMFLLPIIIYTSHNDLCFCSFCFSLVDKFLQNDRPCVDFYLYNMKLKSK